QTFRPVGLARRHWTSAEPIREIFRRAFRAVGLPYYPPHRLRNTIVLLGEGLCQTPEQFKAWSQNLGHSDVLTTFTSYSSVPNARQAEIIKSLGKPKSSQAEAADKLAELADTLRRGI